MKRWMALLAITGLMISGGFGVAFAADTAVFGTDPTTNNGKKWRLAYYEGGEYIDYQTVLIATITSLMERGWIEQAAIPRPEGEQTLAVWQWLATEARSEYLEFVADAHYSSGWDDKRRIETAAKFIQRLSQQQDIDLILALGTWAGQDLANDNHHVPTVVMSTSNALKAGIIESVEDSGRDHIHARIDPYRYERQVRIFQESIGFRSLGVIYEDTVAGRSYAAIDKVDMVAKKRGFEIIRCHAVSDIADVNAREAAYLDCLKKIVNQIDALYVTVHAGVSPQSLPQIVKFAHENQLPTFSQSGSHEVRQGILMSLSQANYKYFGQFNAGTIAKILNGAKPRQLTQLFEAPPKIAINLKTAVLVRYDPPVDVLGAADEVYHDIESK